MLTRRTCDNSASYVVPPTCLICVIDVSKTIRERPFAISVTCVADKFGVDLCRTFTCKYAFPPPVHSVQCESVRRVSKQGCRYEDKRDVEWKPIIGSVSALVKLTTNDASKVSEAIDTKDQSSFTNISQCQQTPVVSGGQAHRACFHSARLQ